MQNRKTTSIKIKNNPSGLSPQIQSVIVHGSLDWKSHVQAGGGQRAFTPTLPIHASPSDVVSLLNLLGLRLTTVDNLRFPLGGSCNLHSASTWLSD